MPVFDATQNQVLFSPVSNYYKGKAIRQQLAAGEQDQELKGLQIDLAKQEIADAPSKRAAAKQKALLDLENIRSQVDERYARGEREKLKYADEVMKPLFQAYSDEPDEEKAKEIFNAGLPEAISRLSEEEQEKFRAADKDRDGEYSHDEIVGAGLYRRVVEEKEKSYTVVPLEEKLAMGMPKEWADNTIVERDAEGNLTFNNRPTGMTTDDRAVRGGIDRETPANRDKKRQEREDTTNLIGETSIALVRNRENPGAAGMLAAGQEKLAGLPGPLGDTADAFGKQLTGLSAAEIAPIRTQARTLAAQMISVITAEESGRYTKEEQQIARDTEAQLSLWRNAEQVDAGLGELQAITLRGALRERGAEFIFHETGKEIDILTEEGYTEWGNILMNQFSLGTPPDENGEGGEYDRVMEELDRHVEIMMIKGRK